MKRVLTSAILLALTATAANAASINIRHEFVDAKGEAESQHKDRLVISDRFDNGIGLSAEIKWQNPKGESFGLDKLSNAGHEMKISYNYKVTDSFTLQPAYALDSSDSGATHKFDLKGTQQLTDDWNIGLRYRYGDANKVADKDSHYSQLNLTSGYNINDFAFGVDIEYKLMQSDHSGFEGDNNYLGLVNFTAAYSGLESGWVPFIELGMVSVDTDSGVEGNDDYRARYRAGVKYSF